ncbi:MAG: class I SAM-dependent methyltransferase [Gammaproteobacteria bacterium]|jgi:SAM-dependent methyltransferase|nr:class I SAM-dependent methyltransferase [Gammaproteobacteria bacterium]
MKNNKKSLITWFVFVLLIQTYPANAGFKCLQNRHTYGVIANAAILDEFDKTLDKTPPLSKTGKSLVTYNRFGFDVIDANTIKGSWLIENLAHFSKEATHPILDIGGGYGRLSKVMTERGATVIYNDLDERHVLLGRQLFSEEERAHLYLNTFKFPRGMIIPPNSLSGVVLHRVVHFMKPDEVEEGIAKIKRWLVPGGKVYIAVLSPHHGEYRDKVLTAYEKRWQQGEAWPGYGFKSKKLLPDQSYALPKVLHLMDKRPLEKALLKYGFVIEKADYIDMKQFGNKEKRDGHELFGIIAVKPKT